MLTVDQRRKLGMPDKFDKILLWDNGSVVLFDAVIGSWVNMSAWLVPQRILDTLSKQERYDVLRHAKRHGHTWNG